LSELSLAPRLAAADVEVIAVDPNRYGVAGQEPY
jgi:hypothetical protein